MPIFGQVWLWSLAAFLLGAILTWVLVVLPVRRRIDALESRLAAVRADAKVSAAAEWASTAERPGDGSARGIVPGFGDTSDDLRRSEDVRADTLTRAYALPGVQNVPVTPYDEPAEDALQRGALSLSEEALGSQPESSGGRDWFDEQPAAPEPDRRLVDDEEEDEDRGTVFTQRTHPIPAALIRDLDESSQSEPLPAPAQPDDKLVDDLADEGTPTATVFTPAAHNKPDPGRQSSETKPPAHGPSEEEPAAPRPSAAEPAKRRSFEPEPAHGLSGSEPVTHRLSGSDRDPERRSSDAEAATHQSSGTGPAAHRLSEPAARRLFEPDPSRLSEAESSRLSEADPGRLSQPEPSRLSQPESGRLSEAEPSWLSQPEPSRLSQPESGRLSEAEPSQASEPAARRSAESELPRRPVQREPRRSEPERRSAGAEPAAHRLSEPEPARRLFEPEPRRSAEPEPRRSTEPETGRRSLEPVSRTANGGKPDAAQDSPQSAEPAPAAEPLPTRSGHRTTVAELTARAEAESKIMQGVTIEPTQTALPKRIPSKPQHRHPFGVQTVSPAVSPASSTTGGGERIRSLFEPIVPAEGGQTEVPPPPHRLQASTGSRPSAPGPFGPGSAMPLPGGASPSPEFTVKASVTALRYCTPDSPQFGRTVAEVWFRSAADAERVGFRPIG